MRKHKRAKALDITKEVKDIVWERDNGCIFCGSREAMPNAHYISRAKGGLGIKQNVVTACIKCHFDLDQTPKRKEMLKVVKEYLKMRYPNFSDEERIYKK